MKFVNKHGPKELFMIKCIVIPPLHSSLPLITSCKFIYSMALSSASSLVPKVTEFCKDRVLINLFHGSL